MYKKILLLLLSISMQTKCFGIIDKNTENIYCRILTLVPTTVGALKIGELAIRSGCNFFETAIVTAVPIIATEGAHRGWFNNLYSKMPCKRIRKKRS